MTLSLQDDHLTAEAWVACGSSYSSHVITAQIGLSLTH